MSARGIIWIAALAGLAAAPVDRGASRAPASTELSASAKVGSDATADSLVVAWVERTLAELSLREQVAQLIFPWINGGSIRPGSAEDRRIRRWIEEDRVGGFIVSRGPVGEFAPTLTRLQFGSAVPLLIISDLETGPGMRLRGGTNMPPAMAFGAANDLDLAFEAGRVTAAEARAAGIHMTLGPVLDVNSNPFNPIINIRSFGEDPDQVAKLASAWIAGAGAGGLLTAGKHFPGHGATELDSHIGLPSLSVGMEKLASLDLVPFRAGIEGGLDAVLVGHIALPEIDGPASRPASLSRRVITGILREDLGFQGVVLTDAMNMGAITRNYGVPEASILAIQAGADILLQPSGERAVIEAVVQAVEDGRLKRESIEESVRRVLRAKAKAGLHEGLRPRPEGGDPPRHHRIVAERITAASITLARDHQRLVPFASSDRQILHVSYAGAGSRFRPREMDRHLTAAGRRIDAVLVDARTSESTYRSLSSRARTADLVIVSANLVPREYRGRLAVEAEFSRFVEGLVAEGMRVVVVSFGSPYLLRFFPSISSYLLAWSGSAEAQRAAADVLLGVAGVSGRLPVSLPPHHSVGEGVTR